MSSYEQNIQALYKEKEFASGGGIYTDPWNIDWFDIPFSARDESFVTPLKMNGLLKELWNHGIPSNQSAVYIHVPFCQLSCTYCAFFKKRANEKEQHEYANLLCKEIASLKGRPYVEKSIVHAVFWGGGTPGILSAEDIYQVMKAVKDTFPIAETAEITMESSLSDMTDEKMDAAMEGGVNRFSFGVQSFQTKIRNSIGRPLSREQVIEKLSHFSKKEALMILDLIYGLPGETEESIRQDIRDAKKAGVAGLDLYKLQLLPKSPLGQAFKKAGKSLDRSVLQSLFRAAESELTRCSAENISCTHWKWNPQERSLYNTLASNGSDIIPIGMACGGKIGELGIMKPMADMMYQGAVKFGKFVPMGAKSRSQYRNVYSAIEAQADKGSMNPFQLEECVGLPISQLLTPILDVWCDWGLIEKNHEEYRYTTAGRYWYRTMMRKMLHAVDHMLFGKPDKPNGKHWGNMINMK